MKTLLQTIRGILCCIVLINPTRAQEMTLTEVLIINTPVLRGEADTAAYEAHMTGTVAPAWQAQGLGMHLFRADRGARNGDYLVVWNVETPVQRERTLPEDPASSGFSRAVLERVGSALTPAARFLSDEGAYTDYVLIGGEQVQALPDVDILGMHYIQVQAGREAAFEAFVRERLYPALTGQIPGMHLLYYKGVRGDQTGRYLTIFALETVQTREQYWPTGAPETEALTAAFKPFGALARELGTYLVADSYLKPETGAAGAIFESLEWTDFVHVQAGRP